MLKNKFEVYERDAEQDGATVLVTGGVHGDEPSGWHAAHHLAEYDVRAGKVVIIPEVNKEAIEEGSHTYSGGNLNRHFPIGEEPESELASQLWQEVERIDPDVFIDLHSSKDVLLNKDSDGIGQAVFHTPRDFRYNVRRILEEFNAEVMVPSDYGRNFYFHAGYTKANSPMLYHKLSSEWGIPTYLIETTRRATDVETRTKWAADIARRLLKFHNVH